MGHEHEILNIKDKIIHIFVLEHLCNCCGVDTIYIEMYCGPLHLNYTPSSLVYQLNAFVFFSTTIYKNNDLLL